MIGSNLLKQLCALSAMVHAMKEGSDQSRCDRNGERSTHYPERGADASTSQGDLAGISNVTTSSVFQERSSGVGDREQRAPAIRRPNSNDLGKEKRPLRATTKGEQTQSLRSKVQEEVRKFLFGPPDAKTPDGERYEIVEEEEGVERGERHTGFLFRFSMWATISFVAWVLAGGRAQIDCPEPFPNIHERDPVPKVIIRRQKKHPT